MKLTGDHIRDSIHRLYNKVWMREFRKKKRRERMLQKGKCPICEMLLTSPWHVAHNQDHLPKYLGSATLAVFYMETTVSISWATVPTPEYPRF